MDEHGKLDLSTQQAPSNHFDDCEFSGSVTEINDQYQEMLPYLKPGKSDFSLGLAGDDFGQALHIIQDFYSHSNWVEIKQYSNHLPSLVQKKDLIDSGSRHWTMMKPMKPLPNNPDIIVVEGEEKKIPPHWTINTAFGNKVPQITISGKSFKGLISGSTYFSDDCPDNLAIGHWSSSLAGKTGGTGFPPQGTNNDGLAKDSILYSPYYSAARALAVAQTTQEWCRLVSMVQAKYGQAGVDNLFDKWVADPYSASSACSCLSPPSGIVSWWPGDNNANDVVGTNHGTLQNGATYGAGAVSQAFNFDGINDGVVIPNDGNNNVPSTGFSVEFWMKADSSQPNTIWTVVDKSHGFTDSTGWTFQGNSGTISFHIGAGGGGNVNFPGVSSINSVLDGNYHHVAGTWDGSMIRLYIDGTLQGQTPLTNPVNNSRDLNLGFAWGGGNPIRFFSGNVDELSIYSEALTQEQIKSIYDVGSSGKCKGT
ncbi:MAG: LamG domain-containing protein [Nitrosopumilaceae archaeon]